MARPLNPQVQTRLLRAAEQEFASAGYRGATVAQIAARAEVSTGNVYRYFANKDAIFYAVLTETFAQTFMDLLQRRVHALVLAEDLNHLNAGEARAAEALLAFWIEHRLKVVVLLDRAQGSQHEGFVDRFVDALMQPTLQKFEAAGAGPLPAQAHLVLTGIFRNTVRIIVNILETYEDPEEVQTAFAAFWSYQLAGLAGFERWVRS